MADENNDPVLFLKAIADATRLKMIGLLAQRPYRGEELAAILGVKPSTISHHLSRLARVGLVSARAEGYYRIYRLEEAALHKMRLLFSHANLVSATPGVDVDEYDRKVIEDFTHPDGSLKEIPAQRKKLDAILRYIVQSFEPGKRYAEKKVNRILAWYHQDTPTLRRELVGARLMEREGGGGEYWRIDKK